VLLKTFFDNGINSPNFSKDHKRLLKFKNGLYSYHRRCLYSGFSDFRTGTRKWFGLIWVDLIVGILGSIVITTIQQFNSKFSRKKLSEDLQTAIHDTLICFPTEIGSIEVSSQNITHITVEEHYLHINHLVQDVVKEIVIRKPFLLRVSLCRRNISFVLAALVRNSVLG
jgi:hypothetical protein